MPRPTLVVNFRSFSSGCAVETKCSVTVANVSLQQGQGLHGSFGRGETFNFMAAVGPDFKSGFVDRMPVGNADVRADDRPHHGAAAARRAAPCRDESRRSAHNGAPVASP